MVMLFVKFLVIAGKKASDDRDVNETLGSETRPRRLTFSPRRDRDRDVERPRPRRFSRRWHFGLPK